MKGLKAGASKMDRRIAVVIYLVVMVVIIIGVDFGCFRNRFWERLIANVGVVLVFLAFYFRFFMGSK
jgi:preprotein translocase subunit SecE